jgi:hypothetical protein
MGHLGQLLALLFSSTDGASRIAQGEDDQDVKVIRDAQERLDRQTRFASTPSGSSYGITVNSLFDSASVTPRASSARIVSE